MFSIHLKKLVQKLLYELINHNIFYFQSFKVTLQQLYRISVVKYDTELFMFSTKTKLHHTKLKIF